MTPEQVFAYFNQLDYALGPEHERGLRTFFHYLHEQGEMEEEPQLAYFQG
jgi:predicted solute-binding protein